MKERIFKREDELGYNHLVVIPIKNIEKEYNYSGLWKKNPDFDPKDPECEEPMSIEECEEYGRESDVYFYDEELTDPVDWNLYEESQEVEIYYDGSNFKKIVLTSDFFTEFQEVTDEFEEDYFNSLTFLGSKEISTGYHKYLYAKDNRYWEKNVSQWQGSWRDTWTEVNEIEILAQALRWGYLDEDLRKECPSIAEMENPQAIVVNYYDNGYEIKCEFEIHDMALAECIEYEKKDMGESATYILPDGRKVFFNRSYFQGELDEYVVGVPV